MNSGKILAGGLLLAIFVFTGCSSNQSQVAATSTFTLLATEAVTPSPTYTPTTTPTHTLTPFPNDGKYRPPQGNYSCDFSDKTTQGSASRFRVYEYYLPESYETVLTNEFGDWYSIEFFPLPEDAPLIPDNTEQAKKTLELYFDAYLERRINTDNPAAKIVEQNYLDNNTPILYAILDLPGGSNLTANGVPMDTTRAVYVVIHGGYSYVIGTQFTDLFATTRTKNDIHEQLRIDLAEFYNSCAFEENPEVGKNFIPPTITPEPDPEDFIPEMKVPAGLFLPDKGSENIEGFEILTKGDWILYRAGLESILPIPKGWSTIETGQATYILFSPTGDPKTDPEINIKLGYYGFDDLSTTSEEPISLSLEAIKQESNFTVITSEIIDSEKGYLFVEGVTDTGTTRYVLQVFSRYVNNPSGPFFHVFTVSTDAENWDQYYPILQAMLGNWHAYDGVSIAVQLPDSLPK